MAIEHLQQILIDFNNKLGNACPESVKKALILIKEKYPKNPKRYRKRIVKYLTKRTIPDLVEMKHSNEGHFKEKRLDDLVDSLVKQTEEFEKGENWIEIMKEKIRKLESSKEIVIRFTSLDEFHYIAKMGYLEEGKEAIFLNINLEGFIKEVKKLGWSRIAQEQTRWDSSDFSSRWDSTVEHYKFSLKLAKELIDCKTIEELFERLKDNIPLMASLPVNLEEIKEKADLIKLKKLIIDETNYRKKLRAVQGFLFCLKLRSRIPLIVFEIFKYPTLEEGLKFEFVTPRITLKRYENIKKELLKDKYLYVISVFKEGNLNKTRELMYLLTLVDYRLIRGSPPYEVMWILKKEHFNPGQLRDWGTIKKAIPLGVVCIIKNRKALQNVISIIQTNLRIPVYDWNGKLRWPK